MKTHYFEQNEADKDDIKLQMCIEQGYVPATCLLGGDTVWGLSLSGKDACKGCECNRNKCQGRSKE